MTVLTVKLLKYVVFGQKRGKKDNRRRGGVSKHERWSEQHEQERQANRQMEKAERGLHTTVEGIACQARQGFLRRKKSKIHSVSFNSSFDLD